jgi:uncharacterized protein (TIGR02117 family)
MGALRRSCIHSDRSVVGSSRHLLVAVLLGAACLGPLPDRYPKSGEASVTIYVVGHGWHTGIVVRRDDVPTGAWPESVRLPSPGFLEVGWGDRAFYESPDAGVSLALKAAFASEASVLHVASFDRTPAEYFPRAEIIVVELSLRGMDSLAGFISRTYARDAAGRPIELGPGLYPGSRFYAATGRYFARQYLQYLDRRGAASGRMSDHTGLGGHGGQPAIPGRALRAGHAALIPAAHPPTSDVDQGERAPIAAWRRSREQVGDADDAVGSTRGRTSAGGRKISRRVLRATRMATKDRRGLTVHLENAVDEVDDPVVREAGFWRRRRPCARGRPSRLDSATSTVRTGREGCAAR